MKVLFVDDEVRVLQGIRRMLHQVAPSWQATFAGGGQEGIQALAEGEFDVVVTDMRMPKIDGLAVLREAIEKYPHVARIVLSGQVDDDVAWRAVPLAHQFMSKPCEPRVLIEAISRAMKLRDQLSSQQIAMSVGKISKLPTAPKMFREISAKLLDPASDLKTIAAIVSREPAISARLLQLVNSAFFSRATGKVSDVRSAVVMLGLNTVRAVVLSGELFATLHTPLLPPDAHNELQQRAFRASEIAKALATGRQEAEDVSTSALLAVLGILVLASSIDKLPDDAGKMDWGDVEWEQSVFGVSHCEIGAYLLAQWGLPDAIVETVARHHRPLECAKDRAPCLVYLAYCLVKGLEPTEGVVQALGLTDRWAEISSRAAEVQPPSSPKGSMP
jgi:HD-like signal output (HDOD) protein/CheY-like chemotaxis protein